MKKILFLLLLTIICKLELLAQERDKRDTLQGQVGDTVSSSEPDGGAEIYIEVDEEAKPVGGKRAFFKLMAKNIRFPAEALKAGVAGRVFVSIVIDEEGKVTAAEVPDGYELGYGMDEEAVRVMKLTKWVPARKDRKVVKQRMIIPVNFSLK